MIKVYESDNLDNSTTLPAITGATLLSVYEAEKYLSKSEREYSKWWWLRSPGFYSYHTPSVDYDGYICGFSVNTRGFVRPALVITNLKSSNLSVGDTFKINGYEFKIISNTLAWLYKQDMGYYPFNKNAEEGNNYNTSDIKKYVDNWFNTEIKPYI